MTLLFCIRSTHLCFCDDADHFEENPKAENRSNKENTKIEMRETKPSHFLSGNLPNSGGDLLLFVSGQIRRHGKTQALGCHSLGHGEITQLVI